MNFQEFYPWIGAALQWARARERFHEVYYAIIVIGSSVVFYALADPTPFREPFRDFFWGWWEQAKGILAATQIVSSISNIAVGSGKLNATSPLVPVTDSKS